MSTEQSLTHRILKCTECFANQMHVCMDGTASLHCTACERFAYPFPANQNLSVFCANTKITGYAECSFHVPGVLCSPQVRGKLINRLMMKRVDLKKKIGRYQMSDYHLMASLYSKFAIFHNTHNVCFWHPLFSHFFQFCGTVNLFYFFVHSS